MGLSVIKPPGAPLRNRRNLLQPNYLRVGRRGLEPRTYGLKVRSSTVELATLDSVQMRGLQPEPLLKATRPGARCYP